MLVKYFSPESMLLRPETKPRLPLRPPASMEISTPVDMDSMALGWARTHSPWSRVICTTAKVGP